MNLILFEPDETNRSLLRRDRRATHILDVLRRRAGDTFDAGIVNGPRGKGTVVEVTSSEVRLSFHWASEGPTPARHGISVIVGLPRPQTARDILRDATTLGVDAIHFVRMEKSEPSYAQSALWTSGEWRRHALLGAEQAFETQLPQVTHGTTLPDAIAQLGRTADRIALDNYEAPGLLGSHEFAKNVSAVLAIGSERGWSAGERELLRQQGFVFRHLGSRVLRTETAVVVALAIVRARRGLI